MPLHESREDISEPPFDIIVDSCVGLYSSQSTNNHGIGENKNRINKNNNRRKHGVKINRFKVHSTAKHLRAASFFTY